LRDRKIESARIVHNLAVVVSKGLLIHVSKQIKILNRNIGSIDAEFQKRSKVFGSVNERLSASGAQCSVLTFAFGYLPFMMFARFVAKSSARATEGAESSTYTFDFLNRTTPWSRP
jgi:hypothetical protein